MDKNICLTIHDVIVALGQLPIYSDNDYTNIVSINRDHEAGCLEFTLDYSEKIEELEAGAKCDLNTIKRLEAQVNELEIENRKMEKEIAALHCA